MNDRTASLGQAIEIGFNLLDPRPDLALAQAEEILKVAPGDPRAQTIRAGALWRLGSGEDALAKLLILARDQPKAGAVQMELGLALSSLGESEAALSALRRAVALNPGLASAWCVLGDHLLAAGQQVEAEAAYSQLIRTSVRDPALLTAADALVAEDIPRAEALLRAHLKTRPNDVAALRMLAETGTRIGRYQDAEAMLRHALTLAPDFAGARHNLAVVLFRQQKGQEALAELDLLLEARPNDPAYLILKAAALALVGDYDSALLLYERLLQGAGAQPRLRLSFGHSLRAVGRVDDAIEAYRHALKDRPEYGEAYWSLANLKTVSFSDPDKAAMHDALNAPGATEEDRLHLHYALGKALEDDHRYTEAFAQYESGARLQKARAPWSADENNAVTRRAISVFTPAFFDERTGFGHPDPAPIFIVGLPRSGSTLIEQVLASHSKVEGTHELPDISAISRRLGLASGSKDPRRSIDQLASLGAGELAALGREYLDRTQIHRKLGRVYFIDKMPNNFRHLGLIALILPKAKIVDARRHPMAACFSAYKQHFARGQGFSYDLQDLGRYFSDYVELMRHFDQVLPGKVHRVIYEDMVEDLEGEVRRLLAYCGLEFESACLNFHETKRAVRTASSEQVRRPIFRDGLDQWRNFEPALDPLKSALGPALDSWRA